MIQLAVGQQGQFFTLQLSRKAASAIVCSPEPEVRLQTHWLFARDKTALSAVGKYHIGLLRNDSDTRGCGCSGYHGYLKACWPEISMQGDENCESTIRWH